MPHMMYVDVACPKHPTATPHPVCSQGQAVMVRCLNEELGALIQNRHPHVTISCADVSHPAHSTSLRGVPRWG